MPYMSDSLDHLSDLRDAVIGGQRDEVLLAHIERLMSVVTREGSRAHSEGIWQGRAETPHEAHIRERDESMAAMHEARLEIWIDAATRKD